MALAATGDTKVTEEVYRACAEELKLVGINWAFRYELAAIAGRVSTEVSSLSPVADVNSDAQNPVIGARSFGDRESPL